MQDFTFCTCNVNRRYLLLMSGARKAYCYVLIVVFLNASQYLIIVTHGNIKTYTPRRFVWFLTFTLLTIMYMEF